MPISRIEGVRVDCDGCGPCCWDDDVVGVLRPPVFASLTEARTELEKLGWRFFRRIKDGKRIIICPRCDAVATCQERGHRWHRVPESVGGGSACIRCGDITDETLTDQRVKVAAEAAEAAETAPGDGCPHVWDPYERQYDDADPDAPPARRCRVCGRIDFSIEGPPAGHPDSIDRDLGSEAEEAFLDLARIFEDGQPGEEPRHD